MKLAIDTSFWSVERLHDLPDVLAEIAAAGYFGFVIDAQRVDLERPDRLYRWATHHALNVVALHADAAHVERVAAFAAEVLAPFVAIAGSHRADRLDALGSVCQAVGVRLVYSGPSGTMPDAALALRRLAAQTDPALVSFALELSPTAGELLPRAGYLTLKAGAPVAEVPDALRELDLWLVVEPSQGT